MHVFGPKHPLFTFFWTLSLPPLLYSFFLSNNSLHSFFLSSFFAFHIKRERGMFVFLGPAYFTQHDFQFYSLVACDISSLFMAEFTPLFLHATAFSLPINLLIGIQVGFTSLFLWIVLVSLQYADFNSWGICQEVVWLSQTLILLLVSWRTFKPNLPV